MIWWFVACGNPELSGLRDALAAYADGQAAIASGNTEAAVHAFARAAESDPNRATPLAWQAWAEDQAGRPGVALALLDEALVRFPDDTNLRYNRAAIRARLGQLEEAASDLRWLYANGRIQPVEVADDPDFVGLGTDPELRALLPSVQVSAVVSGEPSSVVLGERFTLHFDVVSRKDAEVSIKDMGENSGLLRHTRTMEDVLPPERVWSRRRVEMEYDAVVGGSATIGPWLVSSAGTSVLTDRVSLEVIALPGRSTVPLADTASSTRLPSGWTEQPTPPWVGEVEGQRWAFVGPLHTLRPSNSRVSRAEYELRDKGQVVWRALPLAAGLPVEIVQSGAVVLHAPSR